MLTCVVQSSRQHIKRPTPVPSLTETVNKTTANMPNNSRKPKANRLSRKKRTADAELDENWESQSQRDHTLNMAKIALEDKRLALEQEKIERQEKAEQQRIELEKQRIDIERARMEKNEERMDALFAHFLQSKQG
jgi:hypothetical protein